MANRMLVYSVETKGMVIGPVHMYFASFALDIPYLRGTPRLLFLLGGTFKSQKGTNPYSDVYVSVCGASG